MKDQTFECIREVVAPKYLEAGEDFKAATARIARHLADDEKHYEQCVEILRTRRFLPGGRIQASAGAVKDTTAFNCFVSRKIEDSMDGIMAALAEAAQTMRLGGGIGYDFSELRPKGSFIKTLGSTASGPLSFMLIFDAMCETIKSAGHRRGAMMGCLRIDHPDIEEFITYKQSSGKLTNFNISVLVTDEFMEALEKDTTFDLRFNGVVCKTVRAKGLWDKIMRNTWDHAEPGVLFIDTINRKNNLWYCEEIAATNPCGEQPLPPYGACLLGSINLTQYIVAGEDHNKSPYIELDWDQLEWDIPAIHRMMDNVVDRTTYPLPEQAQESYNKRRMGIGITGLANTLEILGYRYGSDEAVAFTEQVMSFITNRLYAASAMLAKEKGPFPLFNNQYLEGEFIKTLDKNVQDMIGAYGIRNSHLVSIAPTGTISLYAGNISGGIEPVFQHSYIRTAILPGNDLERKDYRITDYAYREWGAKCPTSDEVTAKEHIAILIAASKYVDSACSKTCNVGDEVKFDEFKDLYLMAYKGGAKGCTTFRPSGFLKGVLRKEEEEEVKDASCFFDPTTGERSCAD